MRGVPPVTLPESASEKLAALELARMQAEDGMRSSQARINTLPPSANGLAHRLAAERDRHAERHRLFALLKSRVNQWHSELRLAPGATVEVAVIDSGLKLGESADEAIAALRTKIVGVQKEMAVVRSAPLTREAKEDAIVEYLAAQMGRMKPRVAFDAKGRATVQFSESMVVEKSDLIALLCWVLPKRQILAAFSRDLDAEAERPGAVTPAEREAKLADLSATLLSLERRECALLNSSDNILPRGDTDPRAFLGVTITQAQASQSAA
jgi:hypothetical protein